MSRGKAEVEKALAAANKSLEDKDSFIKKLQAENLTLLNENRKTASALLDLQNRMNNLENQQIPSAPNPEIVSLKNEIADLRLTIQNLLASSLPPPPEPALPPTPIPEYYFEGDEKIAVTPENTTHYDVLLLSDSIFRHVGQEMPKELPPHLSVKWMKHINIHMAATLSTDIPIRAGPLSVSQAVAGCPAVPNLKVKKVVVPGARCPRLFTEALILSKKFSFSEVIVHVGTNYLTVPGCSDSEIAEEVMSLLKSLSDMFRCQITFSPILPRCSEDEQGDHRRDPITAETCELIDRIDSINRQINWPYYILCNKFLEPGDSRFKHLLAKDGVHLNGNGIGAMEKALFEYILLRHGPYNQDRKGW